jgi:transposase
VQCAIHSSTAKIMDILTNLLPEPESIVVEKVEIEEDRKQITCTVSAIGAVASCPVCQMVTMRLHSHYKRSLADLPWAGIPVRIQLHVHRFFCDNPGCVRKIFNERLPGIAAPWARRTSRLAECQQAIALVTGGSGGMRLCTALAMEGGIDLLLGLIRQHELPERPTPQVLGVDDWAMCKGQSYGTILVDLEQGNVVDILPDRTAESLTQWLQAHPGVEIVSRDRAGAYAEGVHLGAPNAIQVADRWHLLKNLTECVYKALQQHQVAIEQTMLQPVRQVQAAPLVANVVVQDTEPTAADVARQARATEAHRLRQQGWTVQAISQHLGVCTKTVRRYLNRSLPLTPLRRSRRHRLLDSYKPYLLGRWNSGCHNASQLLREIQQQGFVGQFSIVRKFVSKLRQASGLPPRKRRIQGTPVKTDAVQRPPTLRALAYLLVRPTNKLDATEQEHLAKLAAVHPNLQVLSELAQKFATIVRHRQASEFPAWLDEAAHSQVAALRSFAAGLRQDERAVTAALTLPWSNGTTEGHINRLKCLKRQMYGRAKLDLLRHRLLAA